MVEMNHPFFEFRQEGEVNSRISWKYLKPSKNFQLCQYEKRI